ncbi:DUF6404 family protein [Stenotrophomonas sp. TWI819]|uniref:DUF6404 family protein n=1 Tax=Stenotrophomonas sp. TWI819 TaxID=3136800 RepID=UPI003209592A
MDRYPADVRHALQAMADANVPAGMRAPPLHRLLWRMGLRVPPPLLASFSTNLLLMGGLFGLLWSVLWQALMWLLFELGPFPLAITVGSAVMAGLLFGLLMALLMQYQRRRYRLPAWKTLLQGRAA